MPHISARGLLRVASFRPGNSSRTGRAGIGRGPEGDTRTRARKTFKKFERPIRLLWGLKSFWGPKKVGGFFCFHSLASVRQSALLWGPGRRDINNPEIISHHDIKTVLDWDGAQAVKTYNSNLPTPGMSEDGRSP